MTGTALSIGEQPLKGLINSSAMARMVVSEAMLNLVFALISGVKDIKASGNWIRSRMEQNGTDQNYISK